MALLASTYDQSRFLNAEDLTQEKTLRIKDATEELVGVGANQEKKLVVWFANLKKGLVLNKTNNRTIRSSYGDDTAGWKDKPLVVFPTTAPFGNKMVPALRVRIPPPKENSPAANGPSKPGFDLLKPTTTAAALNTFAGTNPTPASASPEPDPDLNDELPW